MGMAAAAEHRFHVLAVDDSLIDRKLIERLLKTSSYQVTTVDSGSKALEFLGFRDDEEQNNPNQPSVSPNSENHQEHKQIPVPPPRKKDVEVNLVITDYCMPEMTGYDLLKKIKESSSLKNIPVVIMSSENVQSRISRCLEEGAEEFFLKPVQLSDVNKLRPHMVRAKYGHNNHNEMDQQTNPHEQMQDLWKTEQQLITAELPPQKMVPLQSQQQQNSNKRKSMMETSTSPNPNQVGIDEGNITRHRYSGLAVI